MCARSARGNFSKALPSPPVESVRVELCLGHHSVSSELYHHGPIRYLAKAEEHLCPFLGGNRADPVQVQHGTHGVSSHGNSVRRPPGQMSFMLFFMNTGMPKVLQSATSCRTHS